jgi:hypothetical protein
MLNHFWLGIIGKKICVFHLPIESFPFVNVLIFMWQLRGPDALHNYKDFATSILLFMLLIKLLTLPLLHNSSD